jgi:hypothetical protein
MGNGWKGLFYITFDCQKEDQIEVMRDHSITPDKVKPKGGHDPNLQEACDPVLWQSAACRSAR